MLLVEYRRGAGPLLTLAVAVVTWLSLFGLDWRLTGPWLRLTATIQAVPIPPLVFAAAVWQASRERRRDMGDQLASSARATWRRRGLTWASVVLGGLLGVLVPFVAGAVLMVVHGAYPAPGWWWPLLTTVFAVGFHAALGLLVGVVIDAPLVGIVLGITVYVAASDGYGLLKWQSPDGGSWAPEPGAFALNAVALALGVVVLIAVAAANRAIFLAVPAVLAYVVVATGTISFWRVDERGAELVCRESVCVDRASAHQLDAVFAIAKPLLDKVSGIPGAPTTASPTRTGANLWVTGMMMNWRGEQLYDVGDRIYRRTMIDAVVSPRCADRNELSDAAAAWWTGDGSASRVERLSPEAQRRWFADYLSAARRCDTAALAVLR
ncbi:hypothetical protein [Allokutzneria sp. NRRL B-24872]|uniref:hypothetical protein n=1 Tax=Allokutzneria sp. NRRL B-24872 TaxID=1137961 RepID=UPI000A38C235|nr:hypothetical protein [Allokutzneria sp. NRRL B-24872]